MTQSSLFSDPSPRSSGFELIANVDGGARGNPGPAAYGVVVRDAQGKVLAELSKYLGIQTNNYAEYSGLLAALEYATQTKYESIKVISDSELLVRQMQGRYKVNHPVLKQLFDRAKLLTEGFHLFRIEHVLREKNKDADRLVNMVLDRQAKAR